MLSESVKQMFTASQITNAADEEDLTVVDNLLKFADKDYNTNDYSGNIPLNDSTNLEPISESASR